MMAITVLTTSPSTASGRIEKVLGYWIIFLILGLLAVVSTVVASLPLRSARPRVAVLAGHMVVSVVLIASLDGPRPLWVMVFGPGLLVALVRLSMTAYRGLGSPNASAGND